MIDRLRGYECEYRLDPRGDPVQRRQYLRQFRNGNQSRLLEHGSLCIRFVGSSHITFLCGIIKCSGIKVKEILPAESQCFIGTGFADGLGAAEAAPVSGVLFTFALVGKFRNGLDALAPVLKFLLAALKCADIVKTGLDDAHTHDLNIIQKAIGG